MGQSRQNEPQQSLSYSIRDGVFASIQQGAGESYISPFAIFLNASNAQIGLLASIPLLIGACFQFVSVEVLNRLQKRKKIILLGAGLQAMVWIPFFWLPFLFPGYAPLLVILCATAYFLAGNFATPAWNSLMGDLVPPATRGSYFGLRSKYNSIASFAALCLGGLILHYAERTSHPWWGFFVLFSLVLFARLISVYYVSRMMEPDYCVDPNSEVRILDFFRQHRHSNFMVFVYYTAGMHFAIMIASPFFSAYMLRDLHFTYLQFMAAAATTVLIQFLTMHYWGRFSDQFGNKRILAFTGFGLPFLPMLWLFSTDFGYIVSIQIIGGMIWAGFSLSMSNFIFDTVAPQQRAKAVAIYNTMNAVAVFLGASLGGWLGSFLSPTLNLGILKHTFISNLPLLFLISGCLRLLWVLFFIPKLKEVRDVESLSMQDLIFRVTQLRPNSGVKFDVFTGYRRNGENGPRIINADSAHTAEQAPTQSIHK
jgi:MFS family permease